MQAVLIVIHLMVVIALVGVVLLQRSEGGALGIGGGNGFMTGRGQANVLTRATAILAAIFFATSLALSVWANWTRGPKSILPTTPTTTTSAPAKPGTAPSKGDLLDQLKKLEQQRQQQGGAGAPPSSPAPTVPEVPRSQ
jgi:preprotein translocase subunit SecG